MRAGKQPPVLLVPLPPSDLRLSHHPSGLRQNEENKRDDGELDPARAENPGNLSVEDILGVDRLLSGLPPLPPWQSWLWGLCGLLSPVLPLPYLPWSLCFLILANLLSRERPSGKTK